VNVKMEINNKMTKKQILGILKNNNKYKKHSFFYVGKIDLGSQFIMVNIPTEQIISIVKITDRQIIFNVEKITPTKSLESIYNKEFNNLIETNKNFKEKLEELKKLQKDNFILNAEERLMNIVTSKKNMYFEYSTKRVLENFVKDLNEEC